MQHKSSTNKMIEDEMRDAVVLAWANTLIPSTATRSGKKLADVHHNEDLWWCVGGVGGDGAVAGGKVQAPGADGARRGKS